MRVLALCWILAFLCAIVPAMRLDARYARRRRFRRMSAAFDGMAASFAALGAAAVSAGRAVEGLAKAWREEIYDRQATDLERTEA